MNVSKVLTAVAACLAASTIGAAASAATLVGAKTIHITSASDPSTGNSTGSWLQVSEVVALDPANVDTSLASQGATAFAPDKYSTVYLPGADDGPENAIDGVTPYAQEYSYPGSPLPGIYHSATTDNTVSYLDITLAAPTTLKSLSIYGRANVPAIYIARDLYNVDILNSAGQSIFSGQIDARNEAHVGSLIFQAVPEPATWALMIVGFGMAGAAVRRRRAAAVA